MQSYTIPVEKQGYASDYHTEEARTGNDPTGWDSCSQPSGILFPAVGNPVPSRLGILFPTAGN
ncbi:hypothetical protein [Prevotella multiformis]|uniref:hypothetical protein n=1 Tax=Prevotella multiformis TaxID=282402 RepID=UPI003FA0B8E6